MGVGINRKKMGRYAYFRAVKEELEEEDDVYEYKFWVAVQDSRIPWAHNYTEHWVREYDEDDANDMEFDETAKQIWKEYEDQECDLEDQPEHVREVLEQVSNETYYAEDKVDKKTLRRRWKMVSLYAQRLNLMTFDEAHKQNKGNYKDTDTDSKKLLRSLEWYKWNILYEYQGNKEKQVADLELVTTICVLLEIWDGEYECSYEC